MQCDILFRKKVMSIYSMTNVVKHTKIAPKNQIDKVQNVISSQGVFLPAHTSKGKLQNILKIPNSENGFGKYLPLFELLTFS